MSLFDISKVKFDSNSLEQLFDQLKIEGSNCFKPIFDYNYVSKDQITTFQANHGQLDELKYASASHLYFAERVRILSPDKPELAEKVRLSNTPFEDSFVATEDFVKNVDKWNECRYDLAFKCNWLKFTQNKCFADELLETGSHPIVLPWPGNYSIMTAKILMIIREDLRRQTMIAS